MGLDVNLPLRPGDFLSAVGAPKEGAEGATTGEPEGGDASRVLAADASLPPAPTDTGAIPPVAAKLPPARSCRSSITTVGPTATRGGASL